MGILVHLEGEWSAPAPWWLPLDACAEADRTWVGGKAKLLGVLARSGLVVPDGVCLTTRCFEQALRGLDEHISDRIDLAKREPILTGRILAELRETIQSIALTGEVWDAIWQATAPLLRAGAVVVRSSAPDEDARFASYAGIYASQRDVHDGDGLKEAIRSCWASLFNERTAFYNPTGLKGRMALLVQRQVPAELAGVMFTAKEREGEILVEWDAHPEGVTGGRAHPHRVRLAPGDPGSGGELPQALREALLRLAGDAASLLGEPADVEWAWDGEALHCLQARPITVRQFRAPTETTWAIQEDLPRVHAMPLGACLPLFVGQLKKKIWFRKFCLEKGIRIYKVLYLVYDRRGLETKGASLLREFEIPSLRVHWGERTLSTTVGRLIDDLAAGAESNRLPDTDYTCAQISEIVPQELSGFSSATADGNILIEAFPGGLRGTKSGVIPATRYIVSPGGAARCVRRGVYERAAAFDLASARWSVRDVPSYQIDLDDRQLRQIVEVTGVLRRAFGEIRLEWYYFDGSVFVKDLTVEQGSNRLHIDGDHVISTGLAEGVVVRIAEIDAFDDLAEKFRISVVNHENRHREAARSRVSERILRLKKELGSVIVVAEYPSIGLIPLVGHVDGFVFSRSPLLCHTAIVLREKGVPAVVLPDALTLLRDGLRISIDAAGVTVLQPATDGEGRGA